jgi:cell division protein FtsI (penicillin-binding protein 3)
MEMKKEILVRTYLVFIGLVVACLFILGKVLYIQLAQGQYWKAMADSAHIRFESIPAERGTIYSEDGEVLSTSTSISISRPMA